MTGFTLEPLLTVLQKLWKVFWKFSVWTIYIIHSLRKILNVLSFQWIMMGLQSIRDKSLMPRLFNKENSLTNQGYSIVWTVKDLFIEIVRENEAFWEKLYISKFFSKDLSQQGFGNKVCDTWQKVLLKKLEIISKETNRQIITCNQCNIWYNGKCRKVIEIIFRDIIFRDMNWLCINCLSNILSHDWCH